MTAMTRNPTAFWDKIARKYAKQKIANPAAYEATLERTRSYLGAEDRVLELGAGTSSTALLLAPLVGHYVSSDFSAEMVAIGREKLAANPLPNLEIVQGAPGDAALDKGPYDAVLALNLLHLIPDMERALADTARMIRPGGLLISKTPCIGRALHKRLMIAVAKLFYGVSHVSLFYSEELEAKIKRAGFEIVEAGTYPAKGHSRYIVARKLG